MKNKKKTITYWVNRFDRACQNLAFIGTAHPSEREDIKNEYQYSRYKLFAIIEDLSSGKAPGPDQIIQRQGSWS